MVKSIGKKLLTSNFKLITSLFIACIMMLGLLSVTVYANPDPLELRVIGGMNIEILAGDTEQVVIEIHTNPGINDIAFMLTYDKTVLTLVGGIILDPAFSEFGLGGNIIDPGFISFQASAAGNTSATGTFLTLSFEAIGNRDASSPIKLESIAGASVSSTPVTAVPISLGEVTIIGPRAINVAVTPQTSTVLRGNTQEFTAVVTGEHNPAQTVTWTVEGATSPGTTISSSGVLTVGADETAATLTVRATSTVDPVYDTATVTVVPTLTLTPQSVTINNNNLTATSVVGGTATSNITISHNLPAEVTATRSGNNININGTRPAFGQPAITGTFQVAVTRGGITEYLTVVVNLTPLPPGGTNVGGPGGSGGGGGGSTVVNRPGQTTPVPPIGDIEGAEFFHERFMLGFPDGRFMPDGNITRAETAALVVRTLAPGLERSDATGTFSDVSQGAWYFDYITAAHRYGLIQGFPDGSFEPNQPVTREQFAAILARTAEVLAAGNLAHTDIADISSWAVDYVYTMSANDWMQGDIEGTFRPQAAITRAEAAAVICRILGRGDTISRSIEGVMDSVLIFPDAANPNAWHYFYIIEATNSHWFRMDENVEIWTRIYGVQG